MKKSIISKLSLIVALIMLTTALGGCSSGKEKTVAQGSTVQQDITTAGSTVVKEEPLPVTIYRVGVTIGNAKSLVDKIGEATNTKPYFIESGWDEWEKKVALMLTSGDKLDWANVSDTAAPTNEWGKNGLLWNLRPIIEENKDQLKVLYSIINADVYKPYWGPNGEVYGIPAIAFTQNWALHMRKNHLDELGIEAPNTVAGLHDALLKLKAKYEAVKSYYPVINAGLGGFEWAFLAFGGDIARNATDVPKFYKDGDVYKPFDTSDMNKEALKYVRTLYQEGLINPDWATVTGESYKQAYITGRASLIYDPGIFVDDLYKFDNNAREIYLDPPKGPTGVQNYGGTAPLWLLNTITKQCKEPLRVLKMIEWWHSKEGMLLTSYGIEGVHYTVNSEGQIDLDSCKAKRDEDFGKDGGSPFGWGFVSGYAGYLDCEKYPKFEDAYKNLVMFQTVPKKPIDGNYNGYISFIQKWSTPYSLAGYNIEDLKVNGVTLTEMAQLFYTKAIVEKNFNFDSEWAKFVQEYNKKAGDKCSEIVTNYMKNYN